MSPREVAPDRHACRESQRCRTCHFLLESGRRGDYTQWTRPALRAEAACRHGRNHGRYKVDRDTLKNHLQEDRIDYLLVQFVDIHGAPKVKMVPADALDDVADSGAGFAGGA